MGDFENSVRAAQAEINKKLGEKYAISYDEMKELANAQTSAAPAGTIAPVTQESLNDALRQLQGRFPHKTLSEHLREHEKEYLQKEAEVERLYGQWSQKNQRQVDRVKKVIFDDNELKHYDKIRHLEKKLKVFRDSLALMRIENNRLRKERDGVLRQIFDKIDLATRK